MKEVSHKGPRNVRFHLREENRQTYTQKVDCACQGLGVAGVGARE